MSLFDKVLNLLGARRPAIEERVRLASEAMKIARRQALLQAFMPVEEMPEQFKVPKFGHVLLISLNTARTNVCIWDKPGKGLFVIESNGSPNSTLIRFNTQSSAMYPVRPGYIKGGFEKIYLTNTIQTGKYIRLCVAYRAGDEFMLNDPATNDNLIDIYTRLGVMETYQSAHYLTGVSFQTVTITLADTEYSQALTDDKGLLRANLRNAAIPWRVAWTAGKVAAPTDPYRSMPAGSVYEVKAFNMNGKTLYFAAEAATQKMEIEIWV